MPRNCFIVFTLVCCCLFPFQSISADKPDHSVDICIYGGTSGGVVAAVKAARLGKQAILIEPGQHLGGMSSGGLSFSDMGKAATVAGMAREFYHASAGNTINLSKHSSNPMSPSRSSTK